MLNNSRVQLSLFAIVYYPLVLASPTPKADPQLTAAPQATTSVDNQVKRTIFNIVWGCTTTILISTWRTLHPNIPPRESLLRSGAKELELFICAVIAPEIVCLWAFKQTLAALEVKNVYNTTAYGYKGGSGWTKEKWFSLEELQDNDGDAWTLTHGHYLIMGGFHLIEPTSGRSIYAWTIPRNNENIYAEKSSTTAMNSEHERPIILTFQILQELVKDPNFKIRVTEREISDKSRSDWTSKIIFILQTLWFLFQCLARVAQGLGLTQLELTTMAFAFLNAITFTLWIKKPLGAQLPIRVYLPRPLTDVERNADKGHPSEGLFRNKLRGFTKNYFNMGLGFLNCKNAGISKFFAWLFVPVLMVFLLATISIDIIIMITLTFYDVIMKADLPPNVSHIPRFYAPEHKFSWIQPFLLTFLCIIVGGIHCTGWNLTFPSDTQQILWHGGSLAITISPFFFAGILETMLRRKADTSNKARNITFLISAWVYVIPRALLLVQAVVLLKYQPPSAFLNVNWTGFIPHA